MKHLTFLVLYAIANAAGSEMELARLLPADATWACGVNVDQLKSSPSGRVLLSWGVPAEFRTRAGGGLDAWSDVSELLIVGRASHVGTVVIVRGVFNDLGKLDRIRAAKTTSAYRNVTVSHVDPEPESTLWTAQLGEFAVVGPKEEIRKMIDRLVSNRQEGNPRLLARIEDSRNRHIIWGASIGGFSMESYFPGWRGGKIAFDLGILVRCVAEIEVDSTGNALLVLAMLEKEIAESKERGEHNTLYEAARLGLGESKVVFDVSLAAEDFEKWITSERPNLMDFLLH